MKRSKHAGWIGLAGNWAQIRLLVVVPILFSLGATDSSAQVAEFLGEHEVVTLPYEIPGTGRIGGVTLDSYGYLYVANQDERVWKVHPSGEVEPFVAGLFGSASGLVLPRGDLLHSSYNSDRIVRVERDGTVHRFVDDGLNGPVGMVRVGDDVFTVNAKSDWVARISGDGSVSEFVRDSRFKVPNGITADPDGNLYVVSIGNSIVMRIAPNGELTEVATLPGRGNAHVAFAQGALYVTQIWDHVILRVEMDGNYRVVAGDGTLRMQDGVPSESRVPFPNGIAASRSGDVLYFNTLEGNMIAGQSGVIRVHALYPPTFERAFQRAWEEGNLQGLRAKFEAGLSLQEVPKPRMIEGLYQVGTSLLNHGETEAGLALIDWTAQIDDQEGRRSLARGRAHLVHGDRDVALTNLERAAKLMPNDTTAQHIVEAARMYRGSR